MLVNITMLTFGRPRLLEQALRTLKENTNPNLYSLSTFDDGARLGTGKARNEVIKLAERGGRGDYLYLSDLDVAFFPKWLPALVECYEYAREQHNVIALGAYNHPYNGPFEKHPFYSTHLGCTLEIGFVYALATQSWLWRWEDWLKYGPFPATAPGHVCQSEDWVMSQRIRNDGKQVASVYPPLICSTGITNSFGEHIPGYEIVALEPHPEGVIVE